MKYVKSIKFFIDSNLKFIIETIHFQLNDTYKLIKVNNNNNIELELELVNEKSDIQVSEINGEYKVQIFDNTDYIFKFKNIDFAYLNEEIGQVLRKIGNGAFFNSGNYVGIFNCNCFGIDYNINIISKKLNYDSEFEFLQNEISDFCSELLTRSSSYFEQNFVKDCDIINNRIDYSQIAYINELLKQEKLPNWINYIILNKQYNFIKKRCELSIFDVDDFEVDCILNSMNYSNLMKVRSSKSILKNNVIPKKIISNKLFATVDTPENRFVKFFIKTLLDIVSTNLEKVNKNNKKLIYELENDKKILDKILDNLFWNDIGNIYRIPYNSQILQKKYPYNVLFQAYSELLIKSRITLLDIDRKFSVGQKDLPILYQYWVFIKIFSYLCEKHNVKYQMDNWLNYDLGNLSVTLKEGVCSYAKFKLEKDLDLYLYYNKKYTNLNNIYNGRSYSHNLKPDISLELLKDDKLVAIIHFDAKYKKPSDGTFISDDLNKMHTYKDAILGTIGAYSICLCNKKSIFIEEELNMASKQDFFPSVGVLPLNLNCKTSHKELGYINDIIDKFINLAINNNLKTYEKNICKRYDSLNNRFFQ